MQNNINSFIEEAKKQVPDLETQVITKIRDDGKEVPRIVMRLKGDESGIGVGIPIDEMFEKGLPVAEAVRTAAGYLTRPAINPDMIKEVDKEKIFPRLVNRKLYPGIETKCPTRVVCGDLLLYYVKEVNAPDIQCFTVNREIADYWQLTEEDLYNIAMDNLRGEVRIDDSELIREFMIKQGAPEDVINAIPASTCTIMRTGGRDGGAACILLPHVQKALAEKFEGGYIVIPTSTDDVMIRDIDMDADVIGSMVEDVNKIYLPPERRLSDHAYIKYWNSDEIEPYVA